MSYGGGLHHGRTQAFRLRIDLPAGPQPSHPPELIEMTSFLRQKTTAITEADGVHFFWFAGKSNGDVIGLKVTDTSSGMIEVHVLDADDDYQSFKLQKPTPLSLAERPNFYFIGGDGDVIGIKTANTSSGMVEVHSLDGSEGYQKFSLQKTTAIKASDAANFRWVRVVHTATSSGSSSTTHRQGTSRFTSWTAARISRASHCSKRRTSPAATTSTNGQALTET